MEKAKFVILGDRKETVEVMFNPETLNLSSGVSYNTVKKIDKEEGTVQFTGMNPKTLQVTLFLDTYSQNTLMKQLGNVKDGKGLMGIKGKSFNDLKNPNALKNMYTDFKDDFSKDRATEDAREYVKQLEKLFEINQKNGAPPKVIFQWGSFKFNGYVTSFNEKYLVFLSNGKPVRAEVSLSIVDYLDNDSDSGIMQNNAQLLGSEHMDKASTMLKSSGQSSIFT